MNINKIIDLRSNGMVRVNATLFSGLKQLQRLHLSDNWIEELPNTLFKGLINLQVLAVRCYHRDETNNANADSPACRCSF